MECASDVSVQRRHICCTVIEGSFRSQTSDKMDKSKSRGGKSQRRERQKKDQRRDRHKKENPGARKGREVAKHCFSNVLWLRRVNNYRLAKAGAEPSGRMREEKLHAVVARSTFRSQNVKTTSCLEHFWKLRWWRFEVRIVKTPHCWSTFGS